ncbi:hypothetical protein D9M71_721540 [compost metagenome]
MADTRLDFVIADRHALALGFLPQQLAVDQVVQRLFAQAFVHAGVADAGQRPALVLQVFGKIALQAQLADFHAVDPRRGRSVCGVQRKGQQAQQQRHQAVHGDLVSRTLW